MLTELFSALMPATGPVGTPAFELPAVQPVDPTVLPAAVPAILSLTSPVGPIASLTLAAGAQT